MVSNGFDLKKAKKRKLKLDVLRLDGGTQPRSELDQRVINDYADRYKAGDKLPAVHVIHDGKSFWLVDGFHRRFASDKAGLKTIDCLVLPGTLEDARWMSYAANQSNGLYRSVEDKVRAVTAALKHPKAAEMPDALIAEHVGVSQQMVWKYRQLTTVVSSHSAEPRRVGKDGKSRPAKSKPKVDQRAAHEEPGEGEEDSPDDTAGETNDVCVIAKNRLMRFCDVLLVECDGLTPQLLAALLESAAESILQPV
jgi:hypothetical protein